MSHLFVQRKLQAWLIAGQAIYLNVPIVSHFVSACSTKISLSAKLFFFSFDKKYLNKTQLSQKCDNTFVKPLAETNFKGSVLTKALSDDFAELKVV